MSDSFSTPKKSEKQDTGCPGTREKRFPFSLDNSEKSVGEVVLKLRAQREYYRKYYERESNKCHMAARDYFALMYVIRFENDSDNMHFVRTIAAAGVVFGMAFRREYYSGMLNEIDMQIKTCELNYESGDSIPNFK